MAFYPTRELKPETKKRFDATDVEKPGRSMRQAKAMLAVNEMREIAKENGYLTEEEIEAEIQQARKENNLA